MITGTCNLQGLKSSTIWKVELSDTANVVAAYVISTPFFKEMNEGWKGDQFHQYMREILFTHPSGSLRLGRETQKWPGFDLFHKPLILEVIDNLVEPNFYNKVIVNVVESITTNLGSRHDILHEDAECRLYTHIYHLDFEGDLRQVIDVHLDLVGASVFPNVVDSRIGYPFTNSQAPGKV